MPNTTISFDFPEYKLKAIEQALREKQEQKSVQDLLMEHVDGLYQRSVSAPARKYLDALMGDPEQAAVTGQESQPEQGSSRRQYRRRENPAQQQEGAPSLAPGQSGQEPETPEQEQAPGMEMNM